MSYIKQQLKDYLGGIEVAGDAALSIGAQHDDREYFKRCEFKEWMTLDVNRDFTPTLCYDMNKPVMDEAGEPGVEFSYLEKFDYVFAFELWEYIYDPLTAHKNIYSLLKPGGTYMGSYVFVYPHHNPVGKDLFRYTDWGVRRLLEAAGFRDIVIMPRLATAGREDLARFVLNEQMRLSRELAAAYDYPIGYIVTAKK